MAPKQNDKKGGYPSKNRQEDDQDAPDPTASSSTEQAMNADVDALSELMSTMSLDTVLELEDAFKVQAKGIIDRMVIIEKQRKAMVKAQKQTENKEAKGFAKKEKQEQMKQKKAEKIEVVINFQDTNYKVLIPRSYTVGRLRKVFCNNNGIPTKFIYHLSLEWNETIISDKPRKELFSLQVPNGAVIRAMMNEQDDETASNITHESLIGALEETDSTDDVMSINNEGIDEDQDDDKIEPACKK